VHQFEKLTSHLPIQEGDARTVGQKASFFRNFWPLKDGWQACCFRSFNNPRTVETKKSAKNSARARAKSSKTVPI